MAPKGSASFLRRLPHRESLGRGLRRTLWVAGAGLVLYALLLGEGGWLRVARLQAEVDHLESDLRAVQRAQEERRHDLQELDRPGSLVLEQVARERYGLKRPGEKVLHVLGGGEESLAPAAPTLAPGGEGGGGP